MSMSNGEVEMNISDLWQKCTKLLTKQKELEFRLDQIEKEIKNLGLYGNSDNVA